MKTCHERINIIIMQWLLSNNTLKAQRYIIVKSLKCLSLTYRLLAIAQTDYALFAHNNIIIVFLLQSLWN